MSTTTLLPGERCIMSSDDDSLMLTNLRVKYEAKGNGSDSYTSIPLQKVAACQVATTNHLALLILAGFALIGFFAAQDNGTRAVAAALAVAFFVMYRLIRPGKLSIVAVSGTEITVPTKGLAFEQVKKFAEAVSAEACKSQNDL